MRKCNQIVVAGFAINDVCSQDRFSWHNSVANDMLTKCQRNKLFL